MQKGHDGTTLTKVEKPDTIENIPVDPATLPKGEDKEVGYDAGQEIDIDISGSSLLYVGKGLNY